MGGSFFNSNAIMYNFHCCAEEAERIRRRKGRVFALASEPSVKRVWLPHKDFPGLAMSRALGDYSLKSHGVISAPEVFYRRIASDDKFVVLATDGVLKKKRKTMEMYSDISYFP